jgi:hypothetical protein
MMPPESVFLLQQQLCREVLQQAEQARLRRPVRRTPDGGARAFQSLSRWVGRARHAWGCAMQQAGGAARLTEKGYRICLP